MKKKKKKAASPVLTFSSWGQLNQAKNTTVSTKHKKILAPKSSVPATKHPEEWLFAQMKGCSGSGENDKFKLEGEKKKKQKLFSQNVFSTWTASRCPISHQLHDLPFACLEKHGLRQSEMSAGCQLQRHCLFGGFYEMFRRFPFRPLRPARLSHSCSPKSQNNLDLMSDHI